MYILLKDKLRCMRYADNLQTLILHQNQRTCEKGLILSLSLSHMFNRLRAVFCKTWPLICSGSQHIKLPFLFLYFGLLTEKS